MRTSTLLYRMTRRTTLFLTLFQIALLMFFTFGNYQKFLDSNQIIIIRISSFCATALITFCIAGIIESIVYLIKTKIPEIKKTIRIYLILFSVDLIYAVITLIASRAIDILSAGTNI